MLVAENRHCVPCAGSMAFGCSAKNLVEAGKKLAEQPNAMLLRYFAALHDVAGNRTSTIVFPIPMDLLSGLKS